ncbi:MAG: replication-associated recombination protein A, partial [Muribaculaceae bacterium]|nr:replication-associated recombination protein A [Muribaculaceae bacterium]
VYPLRPLDAPELQTLLDKALQHDEILRSMNIKAEETTALFRYAGGDARKLLNILDLLYQSTPAGETLTINDRTVTEALQLNPMAYDKNGEMHYDIVSAFIKSIRGSNPDAAIYWLARMIAGGEDPVFIARRLVIVASEDIGLANPNALLLANATFDTISKIGMPEGRIPLAECTIYLATCEKSNSAYMAINNALREVERSGNLPVPLHIRNAPTSLMKKLGYGKDYKYAHDYPGNFVRQQFLPDTLQGVSFWNPCSNAHEDKLNRRQWERWHDPEKQ